MLLVFVEQDSGSVTDSSLEVLTMARGLATESDEQLHAAVFGAGEELAGTVSRYGVATVHDIAGPEFTDYSPERWGAALAELVRHSGAGGVLASTTDRGNEVLAHTAARLGCAFASNCVAIEGGDPWQLTRLRGGGILLEDAEMSGQVKLASLAAGVVDAAAAVEPAATTVEAFTTETAADVPHSTIVNRTSHGSGVSLATAKVIVSGGRGVGSAEGFGSLEELAELLGGAVGCSRVATNNGWRSHSDQVGLTGTKISADLYIACGISGATQHWVGCMGAKTILAINTDPEAPLVTHSDYAAIGDVHTVLPAVLERIRARRGVAGAV